MWWKIGNIRAARRPFTRSSRFNLFFRLGGSGCDAAAENGDNGAEVDAERGR